MTGCVVASIVTVALGEAGAFFEAAAVKFVFEAVNGAFDGFARSETVPHAHIKQVLKTKNANRFASETRPRKFFVFFFIDRSCIRDTLLFNV